MVDITYSDLNGDRFAVYMVSGERRRLFATWAYLDAAIECAKRAVPCYNSAFSVVERETKRVLFTAWPTERG
jgi:hypothetical protein|nr:MAG TPA_asm: hypothetical protein [Caudoviricetes sp.]